MAESLATTLQLNLTAALTNPVDAGTAQFTLSLLNLVNAVLATGNGADQANQLYAKTQTLAASASVTISLHDFASAVDQLGQVRSITKLKALILQINGSLNNTYVSGVAVAGGGGGTGYLINDVLTVAGGSGVAAKLLVTTIGAGGAITGIAVQASGGFTGGSYTSSPSSPNSPTGGAGTGASITLTISTYVTTTPPTFIDADAITFGGDGATSALTSLFGTNADKFIIQSGTLNAPGTLVLLCGGASAWTVGASTTNKNIKITNASGTDPITFTLVVIGAT